MIFKYIRIYVLLNLTSDKSFDIFKLIDVDVPEEEAIVFPLTTASIIVITTGSVKQLYENRTMFN